MLSKSFHSRILIWVRISLLCLVIFVACVTPPTAEPIVVTQLPYTMQPTAGPSLPDLVVDQVLQVTMDHHYETFPVYQNIGLMPTAYQVIAYPDAIQSELNTTRAYVVQLPDANTREHLQAALVNKSMQLPNSYFDAGLYSFNRSAISENLAYIAVPVIEVPNLDFDSGVQAGILYDNLGFYGYGEMIFNVWLYKDHIELRDGQGNGMFKAYAGEDIGGTVFYLMKDVEPNVSEPVVVFLKNGCWCCWNLIIINGCLICTRN